MAASPSFADFDKQATALSFEDFDRQAGGAPSWYERFSTALGRNLREGYEAAEPAQTTGKKALQAIIPSTPTGAGAAAGFTAAAAKTPAIVSRFPALWRVLGGAAGGELGGQLSGRTTGAGALEGGAGTAIGEGVMAGGPHLVRALPWMKGLISRLDTRRVGRDLERVGQPGMKTPEDFATAATRAYERETAGEAAYGAAQQRHKDLVAEARREAARRTREARAGRGAEWERRQAEYREAVQAAEEEARRATATAKAETERAAKARAGQVAEEQAGEVVGLVKRTTPQLEEALTGPTSTEALRAAGAGGSRKVLGAQKEAVTRSLEEAAPAGIIVPTLSRRPVLDATGNVVGEEMVPVPVRDALEALSRAGAVSPPQFGRHAFERNVLGSEARQDYGKLASEIRQGLDEAQEGLGAVFQRGQDVYKQGLAVTRHLIEADPLWKKTGEYSAEALAGRVVKPRMQRALTEKLGPEATQAIVEAARRLPRAVPKHSVVQIEPVAPPAPVKPPPVTPFAPNLPTAPVKPTPPPADVVMTSLFGPRNRMQQGRDTLINWPEVQKAAQDPQVRATLERALGPEGYQDLLRSLTRGAMKGADVPTQGSGRLGGPIIDWLAGRAPGAGITAAAPIRAFLPNLGAHYVGKAPLTPSPIMERAAALAGQRGISEGTREPAPKPKPPVDVDRIFRSKGITPELALSWAEANRVASKGTIRERLSADPADRLATLRAAFSGPEGQKELRKRLSPADYEAVRQAVFSKPQLPENR